MKAIINRVIKEETDEYMGVMEAKVDLDNLNQKLYIAKDNIPDYLIEKTLDIDLCLYSYKYKTYKKQKEFKNEFGSKYEIESIVPKYRYDDKGSILDELATCIVNGRIIETSELDDNYYLKVMCKGTTLDLMLMKDNVTRITIGDTISASCWTEMIVA